MRTRARMPASLTAAAVVVAFAVGWALFAPTQLGGSASYVIVNGESMRPRLARGDLVIARPADGYEQGDVAAYRHPHIGAVIHRIVGHEGDRLVFKGDGNTWLDSHQPSESEVIGRAWVRVPWAGRLIERLRSPGGLVATSVIVGVLAMSLFVSSEDERPRARLRRRFERVRPAGEGAAAALLAVLFAAAVLGLFAFTRPASVPVPGQVDYEHTGAFGYSADAPAGLYDEEKVRTGEPIFPRVTDKVSLQFDYWLTSDHEVDRVKGHYRLLAQVSDVGNQWKRTLTLQPDTPFRNGRFTATATLDLARLQQLVSELEQRSGLQGNRYAVTFTPQVSVRGTLDGRRLEETFAPRLDFWLEDVQLQLQRPGGSEGDAARADETLHPSQAGATSRPLTRGNTIPILTLDLPVAAARVLSVLVTLLALAAVVWAGVPFLQPHRVDEPRRIRARYGSLLVGVAQAPTGDVVAVAAFEDLVKVATATNRCILHRSSGGADEYFVQDAGTVYHYRTRAGGPGRQPPQLQRLGA